MAWHIPAFDRSGQPEQVSVRQTNDRYVGSDERVGRRPTPSRFTLMPTATLELLGDVVPVRDVPVERLER